MPRDLGLSADATEAAPNARPLGLVLPDAAPEVTKIPWYKETLANRPRDASGHLPSLFDGERGSEEDQNHAFVGGAIDAFPLTHKLAAGAGALDDWVHGADLGPAYDRNLKETDARFDAERDNPAFKEGAAAGTLGSMILVPGSRLGMALYGAAQGAGDARGDLSDTAKNAALGGATGALLHGGVQGFTGAAKDLLGKAGKSALPYLDSLVSKLTNQVGDKAVKQAEKTAASAAGSYRSSRADANRILELLQRPSGDAATDAAAQAMLDSPQGATLRKEVAQSALDRAPDALNNIDSLRALMEQTHAGIPVARAQAVSDEGLKSTLTNRTKEQLTRYAIPAAAGGVGGFIGHAIGGPEGAAIGAGLGAAAGRGLSPGINAVVKNNLLAPERRLLGARTAQDMASKLAGLAGSNPEVLGRFAAPISQAAAKGADALAATHFTLNQDPAYQDMVHKLAENE